MATPDLRTRQARRPTQFDKNFGTQYPAAIQVWRHAWNDFTPFLDYPPELRRIVYTTNLIENINFQLRKMSFPRLSGHLT